MYVSVDMGNVGRLVEEWVEWRESDVDLERERIEFGEKVFRR